MFGKDKDTPTGKEQDSPPTFAAEVPRPQPRTLASMAASPAQTERISTINTGMTIFGKVIGDGDVKVLGRIEGELQAASVQVCEGAQVEGNIFAEQLNIGGRVKGTIHAVRVKLERSADVEGDIFHRSLSIEENARFEGTSRREENLTDKRPSPQAKQTGISAAPSADGNGKYKSIPEPDGLHSAG